MTSSDFECGRRRAAEIHRYMRLLNRLHFGEALFETIVLAVVIERLRFGPETAQDLQILVRARVAFVVREEVAVAALLRVVAARDDVHRETAARIMIERR